MIYHRDIAGIVCLRAHRLPMSAPAELYSKFKCAP
jgi:hypothetical protein